MATIDLIVLGILKKEPMSAYDIQKLVEYRNISKWVKISTPSIYKKVIQLEEKGYITSHIEKDGKMPEKAVYSLSEAVNLKRMTKESQKECLDNIENNMKVLKTYPEKNIALKESVDDIPATGMAVLQQQYMLAKAIEEWICTLKKSLEGLQWKRQ